MGVGVDAGDGGERVEVDNELEVLDEAHELDEENVEDDQNVIESNKGQPVDINRGIRQSGRVADQRR